MLAQVKPLQRSHNECSHASASHYGRITLQERAKQQLIHTCMLHTAETETFIHRARVQILLIFLIILAFFSHSHEPWA
jgi:5-methylcytosine-specific restriction endonuclease McrBC regulatory subunit McrC